MSTWKKRLPKRDMDKKQTKFHFLSVAASLMTLSVPVLYVFGYAYDQGYLGAYGVNNDFFPRSIQDYLMYSFFAFLHIAVSILEFTTKNKMVLFMLGGGAAVVALVYVFLQKNIYVKRLDGHIAKLKKWRWFDYLFFPLLSGWVGIVLPFVIITMIAIILLIPAIAYFKGQDIARSEIENAKSCELPMEGCVVLFNGDKPYAKGRFVARSDTHIALHEGGITSIHAIQEQKVQLISPKYSPSNKAK